MRVRLRLRCRERFTDLGKLNLVKVAALDLGSSRLPQLT